MAFKTEKNTPYRIISFFFSSPMEVICHYSSKKSNSKTKYQRKIFHIICNLVIQHENLNAVAVGKEDKEDNCGSWANF